MYRVGIADGAVRIEGVPFPPGLACDSTQLRTDSTCDADLLFKPHTPDFNRTAD